MALAQRLKRAFTIARILDMFDADQRQQFLQYVPQGPIVLGNEDDSLGRADPRR